MKKFKLTGILLPFLLSACTSADNQEDKPNIIFILADDLGYMDTQAYAQKVLGTEKSQMYYETPNIDKLVEEGVAFSHAYATQLSAPTRASILTGKYAARIGFTTATPLTNTYYNQKMKVPLGNYAHDVLKHVDPIDIEHAWLNAKSNTAMPAGTSIDGEWDEISIAEALTDHHSAFIGKWHLGGHGAKGYQPYDQGFHTIAYYDAGGSPYFNWRPAWNRRSKNRFPDMPQEEWKIGDAGEETGKNYLTDDLTRQAIRYLDERAKQKDQPFFLYFCHFAVHSPWQAKEEDSNYFANKGTKGWNGHHDPRYAGMVRGLDSSVGKIMNKLEETGLEDNTLVIFYSDNGGLDSRTHPGGMSTNNSPLRGGKACLTEGGVRVPLIFRWKGKIKGGRWIDVPVDCTDLFPTILDFADYDVEPYYNLIDIDGRSMLSLISGSNNRDNGYDHETRYWHYPFNVSIYSPFDGYYLTPHSAIMEKNYKLIYDWHGRIYLFDIKKDISESHNLARKMPEKTKNMFKKLITWLESNTDSQYWPKENPEYNSEQEVRDNTPFVNLYKAYKKGEDILMLMDSVKSNM